MATAEQVQTALEGMTARLAQLDDSARAAHLSDRTLSVRVPDLGVTFATRLRPDGADPVTQVADGAARAQVRFTAKSDDVLAIAADPGSFARAWLTGRLKVEGSIMDLLRLRKLL
jgi:predicted lipid carrier protein YhbT